MTKSEYDEHLGRVAEFLAHMVFTTKDSPELETYERLFESIGAAFMALQRERDEQYGTEDDVDFQ